MKREIPVRTAPDRRPAAVIPFVMRHRHLGDRALPMGAGIAFVLAMAALMATTTVIR